MKADKNQTFLPQPFPRWINQWAPLIFLACILLPAVPLTCIRQPVYVRVPFEFTGGDGEAAIRVKVSKAVADWNAAGEKVTVTLLVPGPEDGEERWAGFVRTVVPDQRQQYLIEIRSDLGLLRMQQYTRANSAALRGAVLLKKEELSVLGKIFYQPTKP